MMFNFRRTAGLLLTFIIFPAAVFSFNLEGIAINAGNAIILNGESIDISPAPAVAAPMFGVSVPMTFTDILYFEPGLRVYSTSVILAVLEDSTYKPVPAAIETANRMGVLNIELRPETGAVFNIGNSIMLGVTGAPVFTFRFPLTAYEDAVDAEHRAIARQYYFSAARFLGFYAGGFFSWSYGENTALRVKVGTNLPVYHIWDGDVAGFHDQLIIEPEIGIVWRL